MEVTRVRFTQYKTVPSHRGVHGIVGEYDDGGYILMPDREYDRLVDLIGELKREIRFMLPQGIYGGRVYDTGSESD